ncbi:hypothetical protein LIA77_04680 [Sarocladium implicatum]|nr:hypothetical protein LIA77_04680 [Sarocladium implicatum]
MCCQQVEGRDSQSVKPELLRHSASSTADCSFTRVGDCLSEHMFVLLVSRRRAEKVSTSQLSFVACDRHWISRRMCPKGTPVDVGVMRLDSAPDTVP